MSFLNATLLSALIPLVALPLIIHLFNRRFPKIFAFSSVKNIRETVARRSKLFKWRHWILLLLRTAFLLLLLLAFLKPVLPKFGSTTGDKQGRHVLILLDHSLSMEYKGEGVSSRQRALAEAEKLIKTLGPDDFINIVLVDQNPSTCFVDFSHNVAEARQFLGKIGTGLTRGDFNQGNGIAARLMAKDLSRPELYYLSDFQRKNWTNVSFATLPPSARLFFVDVSSGKKDNHGILAAGINQAEVLAGDTVMLEVTVGNYSSAPMHDKLTAVLDQRTSFQQEVSLAPWSVGKVTLPLTPGAPGAHVCEVKLPPDGLEQDDKFRLTIPVLEKEEVLIISDDPNPEKDAVYYLQTALNPYDKLQGSLLPRHIHSSEVTPAQLVSARKIFLTHSSGLSDNACAALAKFLFGGGGLIYFLDGQADAQNLERLEKAMGPGTMPIKLADRRVAENLSAGVQVIKGDFKSRYLKLFRGATRQDLSLLEFYDFYHASATGAGNILLAYADDTPAMATTGHGLGTLLLMNFSVSEFSSNLARQKIFPAWIQELVKALAIDEAPPESYVVGENIQAEVWRSDLKDNTFVAPSGKPVEIKREPMGERYGVSFVPAELGFYTLHSPRATYTFGVNANADESDLRQVDKQMLPDSVQEGQQSHFVAGQDDFENLVQGRPVFHYFILAGLAVLFLELGFQLIVRRVAA